MKKLILIILIVEYVGLSYLNANQIYEAEEATISQGVVESEHTGFTGSGYVNLDNTVGSYLEFLVNMVSAGNQTVTIYYANGTDQNRSMDVAVNDVDVQSALSFTGTGAWTNYTTQTVEVSLVAGDNNIRFTSSTENGGPNIDKIEVTGESGTIYYKLNYKIYGQGTVTGATDGEYFEEGTELTLSAEPATDEFFGGWRGDIDSDSSSINIKMDTSVYLFVIFLRKGAYVKTDEQIGWASYQTVTTGGEGGTEVVVTNQSELQSNLTKNGKYIIKVSGTINISPIGTELNVSSDKTIIGDGLDAKIKGGGLRIGNANNVIVKYLTFKDAYVTWDGETTDNDAIEINNSTHIWIDHCDFSHFDDGLIDIKNASDYVTISWCHFHNHNKVMLIGAGDDATQDIGHLSTTVHHCWFDGIGGKGIGQRLPMGRFGMIHVFNCYFNDVITRGVEANYDANMVVDNNYFLNTPMPHVLVGGAGNNKMNASGNIYDNTGDRRDKNGAAFTPSDYYSYKYNEAEDVPSLVMLGAGVNYLTEIGEEDTTTINIESIPIENHIISLWQNYPNPFSHITTITYYVPEETNVKIEVFDITGKKVLTLINDKIPKGIHSIKINANDLKQGLYFYQLVSKNYKLTRTMKIID